MTTQTFEVYKYGPFFAPDENDHLATFTVREAAFDFARAHAIEHRCNMLVRGPAKAPEAPDVRF